MARKDEAIDEGIVYKVAVLDYKHVEHQAAIKRAFKKMDDHEERIRDIELKIASQLWVERGIWVAVSAAISFILSK